MIFRRPMLNYSESCLRSFGSTQNSLFDSRRRLQPHHFKELIFFGKNINCRLVRLTDKQIGTYRKQGFLIVENFLTSEEREAALEGFFHFFSPSFEDFIAADRQNNTPQQAMFPWDHSGLNHVTTHPDLVDAAERILGTGEIRLCEGHLGMKYGTGEYGGFLYHIDYGNNTLGPILDPDDFSHLQCMFCFEDVGPDTAPVHMVPNGRSDEEAVPMIVPGGSVCLYSIFTRHSPSPFTANSGHRPAMWTNFSRKDRPWDGGRTFTYKSGAGEAAMARFLVEATPRQRELLGFPPPGDPLWTEAFTRGMVERYPGFDAKPYQEARQH